MMQWPFQRFAQVLKNGAQAEITITTTRDEPDAKGWWADTIRLVRGLSEGDASTLFAAGGAADDGKDAPLLTAEGSVTNELWARLVHLGYMVPRPDAVPEGLPEEVKGQFMAHSLTRIGRNRARALVGHHRSQDEAADSAAQAAGDFAERFATMGAFHRTAAPDILRSLVNAFSQPGEALDLGAGSPHDKLLSDYGRTGAVERLRPGVWTVTLDGTLHAQFLIDKVLHQRAPAAGVNLP